MASNPLLREHNQAMDQEYLSLMKELGEEIPNQPGSGQPNPQGNPNFFPNKTYVRPPIPMPQTWPMGQVPFPGLIFISFFHFLFFIFYFLFLFLFLFLFQTSKKIFFVHVIKVHNGLEPHLGPNLKFLTIKHFILELLEQIICLHLQEVLICLHLQDPIFHLHQALISHPHQVLISPLLQALVDKILQVHLTHNFQICHLLEFIHQVSHKVNLSLRLLT